MRTKGLSLMITGILVILTAQYWVNNPSYGYMGLGLFTTGIILFF